MTSYRDSGVDIDAQDEALREVRHIARGTFTPNVISDIGSFGGLFHLGERGQRDPVLVASGRFIGAATARARIASIFSFTSPRSAACASP